MKNDDELNKVEYQREMEKEKAEYQEYQRRIEKSKRDNQTFELVQFYTQNQLLLTKFLALILISVVHFVYFILSTKEPTKITQALLITAVFGFGSAMLLQIFATKNIINGCDLFSKNQEISGWQKSFEKARKFNKYFGWCFFISTVLIVKATINIGIIIS